MLDLSNLDPKKKKNLITGAAASGALLIAALVLSLSSGEDEQAEVLNEVQQLAQQSSSLPLNHKPAQQGGAEGSIPLQQLQSQQGQKFGTDDTPAGDGIESLLQDKAPPADTNPFKDQIMTESAPLPPADRSDQSEELTAGSATSGQYNLYCDRFTDAQAAEGAKAMLAFQGIMSSVVSSDEGYRLKVGPFESSDKAKSVFNDLGNKGLVKQCSLIKK